MPSEVSGDQYRPRMSWASSDGVRKSMRSNRSSGTRPELGVRRALHALGLRFRVQFPVPGAPRRRIDIAFTRFRIAVNIDGCFWHGCPVHRFVPKTNADYWSGKFAANRERDAATTALLQEAGWCVLRFWEHQPLDEVVATVLAAVRAGRDERGLIAV